jgi:hypothetical protein
MANATVQDFPTGARPPEAPPAPQVLVRTFTIPAGLPWDQTRAAQLEARHGAPLPIGEVLHRLKRLEGWGLTRSARFAVFYVRRRDYSGPFETTVDVEGETVQVAFGAGAAPSGRRPSWGRLGGLAGFGAFFAVGAVVLALLATSVVSGRDQAEQRLETLESSGGSKLRAARKLEADRARIQVLNLARGSAATPQELLDDLSWISHARTPDARLVAVHWDHGLIAVESRGESVPLVVGDRQIVRAARAKSALSLWGVSRAHPVPNQRPTGAAGRVP